MYVTPEQIQAAGKANVETMLSLAATQFAAIEKLATLNANAVKTAFEDSLSNTRALFGAKDVQEFVTLQNTLATPAIEKAIAEWNENFSAILDKAVKNAPAGSDVAVAAVKSMIAAANSAYDNMTKVAKQATEIAEANVNAASETVKGLTKAKKPA